MPSSSKPSYFCRQGRISDDDDPERSEGDEAAELRAEPADNATEAADDEDGDGDIASGGMKWKRGSGKRKERKQKLTMEDLEDDEVADEHFRPPKGEIESSSSSSSEDDEEVEEVTPPKRSKVRTIDSSVLFSLINMNKFGRLNRLLNA